MISFWADARHFSNLNNSCFISGPPRDSQRFTSVELSSRGISSTSYGSVTKNDSATLGNESVRWVPQNSNFKFESSTADEYSHEQKNSIQMKFK